MIRSRRVFLLFAALVSGMSLAAPGIEPCDSAAVEGPRPPAWLCPATCSLFLLLPTASLFAPHFVHNLEPKCPVLHIRYTFSERLAYSPVVPVTLSDGRSTKNTVKM
ncbi:hypothetical protein [Alloalcanivorax mobilis]|uniref:hypothetical protein n=1 Tax=Alloalcanivorax mobilis TaxID=2019569 RepID=UPI0018E463A8|nr:hypothetical protein [Alloalcanivorax mobilis]